jgi:O-antigen ligase
VRTALLAHGFVLLLSFWSMSASYLPPDERDLGDHAMVTAFSLIFVGLAVCDGVTTRRRIYFLVRVIVGCAVFVAIVGVLQYVARFDLTPYLKLPGMRFTAEDVVIIERSGIPRVSGTTAHPIEFGVFCAMVLPLALHLATHDVTTRRMGYLRWAAVVLLAVGLMFSVSRSAIIAVATVGAVLALGWSTQRRLRMLTAGVGFLLVLWLLAPSIPGTLVDLFLSIGHDGSVEWRTHDYATTRHLVAENPLLGRGVGTWYPPKHEIFDNQYLMTLVSTGILGLCALLGVMGSGVYAAVRSFVLSSRRPAEAPGAAQDRDLAHSLAASVMVVFPTFATFDFMDFSKVASLALLLVGLAGALLRIASRERAELTPRSATQT